MNRQSGFTLVEIAIVLVVIGLLLGGVLKGQELVLNSQIRNVINEYNNVASARFAYQDRYRQIPGDDPTANARWGATNGNGDRFITGAWNLSDGSDESSNFWQHLRNDRLVVGPTAGAGSVAPPLNAFDGLTGIQAGALGISLDAICQNNVPAKAAVIIDTRIDDEDGTGAGSGTGILQAVADSVAVPGNASAGAAPAATYDNVNSNTKYILCREL